MRIVLLLVAMGVAASAAFAAEEPDKKIKLASGKKDIAAGDMGSAIGNTSNPAYMVSLGDKAYFAAKLSFDDDQFFVSDGTEEGTELLEPEDTTNEFDPVGTPFVFGNQLLVTGRWNDLGVELYRYRPDASR